MEFLDENVDFTHAIIGNFNTILSPKDKRGSAPVSTSPKDKLQGSMGDCMIKEVLGNSTAFSGNNKRDGDENIQKKLNRVIANKEWLDIFPDT